MDKRPDAKSQIRLFLPTDNRISTAYRRDMFKKLFKRLSGNPPSNPNQPTVFDSMVAQPLPPPRTVGLSSTIPVYPPVDRGISIVGIDEVLATQVELLRRLKISVGMPPERFDELFMTPIRNLARHVSLLPASEVGTHRGPGGLFRLALELSFFSWQRAEDTIFAAREGVERRRVVEPWWRYATWLAALCCELYRPVANMIVVSEAGNEWPQLTKPLIDWSVAEGGERIFVRWRHPDMSANKPGQSTAALIVNRIVPESSLQYLQAVSSQSSPVVTTFLDYVTGVTMQHDKGALSKIVNDVRSAVFARDDATRPASYGQMISGSHLEPVLLDAMRRLTADGMWKINAPKARLWYSKNDGLYLVWRTAATEILNLLKADGTTGIPVDPQTLLEILCKAKVFTVDADGSPYHTIISPLTQAELMVVRFGNPLSVLGGLLDEPDSVPMLLAPQSVDSDIAATEEVVAERDVPAGSRLPKTTTTHTELPADAGKPVITPEDKTVEGVIPVDATKGLPAFARDLMEALISDMNRGVLKHTAGPVDQGFAISLGVIADYGADPTQTIDALYKLSWLWTHPDKPQKKLHSGVTIRGGVAQQVIIIREPYASNLGLTKI